MTDKIITTLETTITWFDIYDKKPDPYESVLIVTKNNHDFFKAHLISHTHFVCKYTQNSFDISEIEWWASLPTLD